MFCASTIKGTIYFHTLPPLGRSEFDCKDVRVSVQGRGPQVMDWKRVERESVQDHGALNYATTINAGQGNRTLQ